VRFDAVLQLVKNGAQAEIILDRGRIGNAARSKCREARAHARARRLTTNFGLPLNRLAISDLVVQSRRNWTTHPKSACDAYRSGGASMCSVRYDAQHHSQITYQPTIIWPHELSHLLAIEKRWAEKEMVLGRRSLRMSLRDRIPQRKPGNPGSARRGRAT
jgi:hypothetical protein